MSRNMIIGLGNTGTQIVKEAARNALLSDTDLFAIDSVASTADMNSVGTITTIPIITDDKSGSGRDRERGAAMFEMHNNDGEFSKLYAAAENAKSPVIVIASSAGGTGSGAIVPLCRNLLDHNVELLPIIVAPAMEDPIAFQMNTNDLFVELNELGIETYCVFRNEYGKANYQNINNEIVNTIEIIFGKRYDISDFDTIDDADVDKLLQKPGRLIAVEASAASKAELQRAITEKVLNGFQPAWNMDKMGSKIAVMAFALTSPFASVDFEFVFKLIRERLTNAFDEYRNVCDKDGVYKAVVIIAGLPQIDMPNMDFNFDEAGDMAEGMKKAARPSFMNKKSKIGKKTPTASINGIKIVGDK